jgi:hypothetical protein
MAETAANAPDRIRLDVNMREDPGSITWASDGNAIKIKLMNAAVDLSLDLGPAAIRQLKQALAWS